MDNKKKR